MPRKLKLDKRRTWWDEGTFKKYATSVAYKNRWRMGSWVTVEDLVGEGYVVFLDLLRLYPKVVERSHLMSLYCRRLMWHYISLAKRWGCESEYAVVNYCMELDLVADDGFAELELIGELSRLPTEVFTLLKSLLCEDVKLLSYQWVRSHRKWGKRETTKAYLARLSQSVDPDVMDKLQLFLRGHNGSYQTT